MSRRRSENYSTPEINNQRLKEACERDREEERNGATKQRTVQERGLRHPSLSFQKQFSSSKVFFFSIFRYIPLFDFGGLIIHRIDFDGEMLFAFKEVALMTLVNY